ncbi:DUF3073 family protein [Actinomadura logoneensis]|uniref:DUF3073 family protein n=1 Tax=Actinomadura logoneensis TaxID=2293572 RepID=A0A372JDV4_9ACTN|nr:DUF3073 family protein [Actinomadura logoneensis]RFU38099.1 DUF3073 family protein [Actinomadura logoneensis]
MGRGRAKAEQAKVARGLKYHSGGVDLDRLRRELGATGGGGALVDRAEEEHPHPAEGGAGEAADEGAEPERPAAPNGVAVAGPAPDGEGDSDRAEG